VKERHEIRDPIYGFIHVSPGERNLIDTEPFQRLRHIHQLALTSLLYPGATHKRFEHSLGVMHLAGRVYDTLVSKMRADVRERLFPDMGENPDHWRRIVCAAALLHDIGHLPFSHAAEDELLPEGMKHESLTVRLLKSQPLRDILTSQPFYAKIDTIVKLAVGEKDAPEELVFSEWESILAEIITGNFFGVDRLDYLMRDSYHAGVAYGNLDYLRLTDSLRILPLPEGDRDEEAPLRLGLTRSGLYSAEALIMARHWMFAQVYYHRIRMVYDHYLCRFLLEWLGEKKYPIEVTGHLGLTDNEVYASMRLAAKSKETKGHVWAHRILARNHHGLLHSLSGEVGLAEEEEFDAKVKILRGKVGESSVLVLERGRPKKRRGNLVQDFPVELLSGEVKPSTLMSEFVHKPPSGFLKNVYVEKEDLKKARRVWDED
jgi:uncharacterized protein